MIELTAFSEFFSDGDKWNYRKMVFSGGEIQVRLDKLSCFPLSVTIDANLRDASEIIELLMVTDAIRRTQPLIDEIHLVCPYFPYARQDRACAPGEAFSAEVMASLINSANYASVTLWDVHSKVSLEKLHRSQNVMAGQLIPPSIIGVNTILVSPDKGAIDRVMDCAKRFGQPMIVAEKVRNPDDGKITGTFVPHFNVSGSSNTLMTDKISGAEFSPDTVDFLMVDDICDGGRTFLELAKVLRPFTTGRIGLWVTHGIFSAGFDVFNGLIDDIYTANSFQNDVPDFVHVGYNR